MRKCFLRSGEAQAVLGVTRWQFRLFVACGVLKALSLLRPRKAGRRHYVWFRLSDVMRVGAELKREG